VDVEFHRAALGYADLAAPFGGTGLAFKEL